MIFWPLTNREFPTDQTFHQFYNLDTEHDRYWIMTGFHGAFPTGIVCQQGTLTPPDTWFCSLVGELIYALIFEKIFPDSTPIKWPNLNFTELREVSMEHLRRVWHTSMERLSFRKTCSVPPFWTCLCSNCWDQTSRTCRSFNQLFTLYTTRYFLGFAYHTYVLDSLKYSGLTVIPKGIHHSKTDSQQFYFEEEKAHRNTQNLCIFMGIFLTAFKAWEEKRNVMTMVCCWALQKRLNPLHKFIIISLRWWYIIKGCRVNVSL